VTVPVLRVTRLFCPAPRARPVQVLLTASARSGFHEESAAPMALYQSFGVGAAEVEIDCVTGERTLLRADIMFDAGKSVSPAIDMGQVSTVCLLELLYYTVKLCVCRFVAGGGTLAGHTIQPTICAPVHTICQSVSQPDHCCCIASDKT
jgi:hypothetical protein